MGPYNQTTAGSERNKMSEEKLENEKSILQDIREALGAIYIQSARNYDMLSIIADKLGADATKLTELHESGILLAPAPSFSVDDNE
jgi:hypothetical protein